MAITTKISVALGRDELRHAKRLAARNRTSLSSVITEAVREHVEAQARKEAGEALLRTFPAKDRASPSEMDALLDLWAGAERSGLESLRRSKRRPA